MRRHPSCRSLPKLGGVALDARRRAARVDAGSGEAVADFYMHLWKCFFACYALLPFVR